MQVMESLLSENKRILFYRLLGDCFYLPDEKLLEKLRNSKELIGEVCDELKALVVDFSRLFVGPFKLLAPPYGSIYLEHSQTIMGDSTIDVRDRYRQEGLKIDLKEAPDHIAIELEFMYFLGFQEIKAIGNSDTKKAKSYLRKQADFLDIHLCKWVPQFTDKIEQGAQTEFYKNLAKITKLFIQSDLQNISNKVK